MKKDGLENNRINQETKRHFSEMASNNSLKKAFYKFNLADNKKEILQTADSTLSINSLKLKANSIFAFQNDFFYSKLCNDAIEDTYSFNQISQISANTANSLKMRTNLAEKSLEWNLMQYNSKLTEGNSVSCSISSELEKNLETLLDEINSVEDLNEAKIDWSELGELKHKNNENNNSKIEKSITSLKSQHNNNFIFDDKFEDLIVKEEEKENHNKKRSLTMMPSNSDEDSVEEYSSNEKSEKYDEIVDIYPDKNEKMEANTKRVSAENGSLVTQSSFNSLLLKNKFQKPNDMINQSNSFDWSNSKSVSPNLSNSNGLNSSFAFHSSLIKRGSNPNQPSISIQNINSDNTTESLGRSDRNYLNKDFSQFRHNSAKPSTSSPVILSNPTYNYNDQKRHTNNLNTNFHSLNYNQPMLPSNPAFINLGLNKSFNEAFSLNRDFLSNAANKNSASVTVNNKLPYKTMNNDCLNNAPNSCTNYLINTNQITINSNANINNHPYNYSNFEKNPNANTPYGNIVPKNNNTAYNLNLNNYLYYNDEIKLLENINILLQEQAGCRFVQLKIEEIIRKKDITFLYNFFEAIKDNLINIIKDQFGNYVIQKFFEGIVLDSCLLSRFFQSVRSGLFSISIHPFGTRFFQKSLESLALVYDKMESEVLNQIFRELIINYSYDLIIDTNGNHVFQKILMIYPRDKNQFIYNELNKISLEVAKIKQGGCIFQRAFDIATPTQIKFLITKILTNIHFLINDEYGNFIIQNVIYLKIQEVNDSIFNFLKGRLLELSKKKFSSNVIDKCILMDDALNQFKLRHDIINALIDNKCIGELICDVYGNYVAQKALNVSEGNKFLEILNQIKSSFKILKQTQHGKKIYENLISLYGHQLNNNSFKVKN